MTDPLDNILPAYDPLTTAAAASVLAGAAPVAAFAGQAGTFLTIGAQTLPCSTRRLEASKLPASAPDGAGGNLDALDPRVFSVAAALLPGGPPAELTAASWLGRSYTIVEAVPVVAGASAVAYDLTCYRTPAPPTANTGTVDGTRKTYFPPPTTL